MTDRPLAKEFNVDKFLAQKEKKPVAKAKAIPAADNEAEQVSKAPPWKPEVVGEILRIPLDKIRVPPRLRAIDGDHATSIADSMAINGQQSPVEVTPADKNGLYTLIAGAHRVSAAHINDWHDLNAVIFRGDANQIRLREIDENLIRRELSPLDQAVFLAERKRIYEEIYPESRAGAAGAAARWHASAKLAFASDAAEKCGISERSIERAIQRFSRIAPDVREKIALTWIAGKGVELDALAKLAPDEQRKAIDLLFAEKDDAPKSVNEASKLIRGVREQASNGDADADFTAFTRSWNKKFSAKTKRDILAWLEAEGHLAEAGEDGTGAL